MPRNARGRLHGLRWTNVLASQFRDKIRNFVREYVPPGSAWLKPPFSGLKYRF
jgi:hypothetical protein